MNNILIKAKISFLTKMQKYAQGHLARKSFAKKIFKWSRGRRGGFVSYWNPTLIKFEEEKRFGL